MSTQFEESNVSSSNAFNNSIPPVGSSEPAEVENELLYI